MKMYPGTIVMVEGVLLVIEEYSGDQKGYWENSPPMYACRQIVSTTEFTNNDIAVGLPGCWLLTERDWERPLSECWQKVFGPNLVICFDPCYVSAKAVTSEEVQGKLTTQSLTRTAQRRNDMIDSAEAKLLNEEDWYRRDGIKQGARLSLGPTW